MMRPHLRHLIARPCIAHVRLGRGYAGEIHTRTCVDGYRPSIGNRLSLPVAQREICIDKSRINRFAFKIPHSQIRRQLCCLRAHRNNPAIANHDSCLLKDFPRCHHHPRIYQRMRFQWPGPLPGRGNISSREKKRQGEASQQRGFHAPKLGQGRGGGNGLVIRLQ